MRISDWSSDVCSSDLSIGRAADQTAPVTPNAADTPDEGWGFNARATWEPLLAERRIVHLGAGAYWRTGLRSATAIGARISERPNVRVDNGTIIDRGVIAHAHTAFYSRRPEAHHVGTASDRTDRFRC